MKQSFYLILSLLVVFLFGAWGHSLYTRHFDTPAKTDETLWGDPAEIEKAYELQRNLYATVASLSLETPSSYSSSQGARAWFINRSHLDSLLETLDAYAYSRGGYYEPNFQVVLARYPSGRPKFISVLWFYKHENKYLRSICGVEKNLESDLFVFCPRYYKNGDVKTLLRYDSPDGKYSAVKFPSESLWGCSTTEDSVHTDIRVSKPEYCAFDLPIRFF